MVVDEVMGGMKWKKGKKTRCQVFGEVPGDVLVLGPSILWLIAGGPALRCVTIVTVSI